MNNLSRSIKLSPRDAHFDFKSNGRRDWLGGDIIGSIVFNALSITFPEGEKFFIQSVRNVQDRIDDPVLHEQIRAFVSQEAMHTREHIEFNKELEKQGFSATELAERSLARVNFMRSKLGKTRQLGVTCALEHFTATISHLLLSDPSILAKADEQYRQVWQWHAIEEIEHKGVAYDAFQHITGGQAYGMRCRIMLLTIFGFLSRQMSYIGVMLDDAGLGRSPLVWARVLWFLWGKPGLFRRVLIPWLGYFKPGFHPWQHDNRDKIAETEATLMEEISAQSASPALAT